MNSIQSDFLASLLEDEDKTNRECHPAPHSASFQSEKLSDFDLSREMEELTRLAEKGRKVHEAEPKQETSLDLLLELKLADDLAEKASFSMLDSSNQELLCTTSLKAVNQDGSFEEQRSLPSPFFATEHGAADVKPPLVPGLQFGASPLDEFTPIWKIDEEEANQKSKSPPGGSEMTPFFWDDPDTFMEKQEQLQSALGSSIQKIDQNTHIKPEQVLKTSISSSDHQPSLFPEEEVPKPRLLSASESWGVLKTTKPRRPVKNQIKTGIKVVVPATAQEEDPAFLTSFSKILGHLSPPALSGPAAPPIEEASDQKNQSPPRPASKPLVLPLPKEPQVIKFSEINLDELLKSSMPAGPIEQHELPPVLNLPVPEAPAITTPGPSLPEAKMNPEPVPLSDASSSMDTLLLTSILPSCLPSSCKDTHTMESPDKEEEDTFGYSCRPEAAAQNGLEHKKKKAPGASTKKRASKQVPKEKTSKVKGARSEAKHLHVMGLGSAAPSKVVRLPTVAPPSSSDSLYEALGGSLPALPKKKSSAKKETSGFPQEKEAEAPAGLAGFSGLNHKTTLDVPSQGDEKATLLAAQQLLPEREPSSARFQRPQANELPCFEVSKVSREQRELELGMKQEINEQDEEESKELDLACIQPGNTQFSQSHSLAESQASKDYADHQSSLHAFHRDVKFSYLKGVEPVLDLNFSMSYQEIYLRLGLFFNLVNKKAGGDFHVNPFLASLVKITNDKSKSLYLPDYEFYSLKGKISRALSWLYVKKQLEMERTLPDLKFKPEEKIHIDSEDPEGKYLIADTLRDPRSIVQISQLLKNREHVVLIPRFLEAFDHSFIMDRDYLMFYNKYKAFPMGFMPRPRTITVCKVVDKGSNRFHSLNHQTLANVKQYITSMRCCIGSTKWHLKNNEDDWNLEAFKGVERCPFFVEYSQLVDNEENPLGPFKLVRFAAVHSHPLNLIMENKNLFGLLKYRKEGEEVKGDEQERVPMMKNFAPKNPRKGPLGHRLWDDPGSERAHGAAEQFGAEALNPEEDSCREFPETKAGSELSEVSLYQTAGASPEFLSSGHQRKDDESRGSSSSSDEDREATSSSLAEIMGSRTKAPSDQIGLFSAN